MANLKSSNLHHDSECLSDVEGPCMKLNQNTKTFEKIYPTIEELTSINNAVKCVICDDVFKSESNLNLHLYKRHGKKEAFNIVNSKIKQFYCPDAKCVYHDNQCFKSKKLLKQHYLKVHSPKTYFCETCHQGFSSRVYKNLHVDYCGVSFKCNECPVTYPRYESLLTHGRRKKHAINEKNTFKIKKEKDLYQPILSVSKSETNVRKLRELIPKPFSEVWIPIKLTQGIQTTVPPVTKLKSKFTQIVRNSRETQTGHNKKIEKVQLNVETQTIGDYINVDKKKDEKLKSTQTNVVQSKSVGLETKTDFNMKKSSSSTQTTILFNNNVFINTHDSIDTDTSDLIQNFDTNFFNCNTETQTDLMFNDDFFDCCEFYSNMYTQTCDNPLLMSNSLELNNIETQTINEMLRSVESQTMMSKKSQNYCRDMSHMETQTDAEFRQILEAINA